jgi:membrane protease YdiL (CAAX protease family)
VGLFVVLPLWITYEVLRLLVVPDRFNGAEILFYMLPPIGLSLLTLVFGLTVLVCAWSIVQRDIPWMRVGLVTVLEGLVYGLIIGPLASALTSYSVPVMATDAAPMPAPAPADLTASLVGALGAGIYEELLFRLLLLSLLAWLFTRTTNAFGLPKWPGVVLAMLVSSLLFALLHHVGQNLSHVDRRVFLFRTMAGLLLALLFVFRGIGVCVYTHALYNVHFYLVQD